MQCLVTERIEILDSFPYLTLCWPCKGYNLIQFLQSVDLYIYFVKWTIRYFYFCNLLHWSVLAHTNNGSFLSAVAVLYIVLHFFVLYRHPPPKKKSLISQCLSTAGSFCKALGKIKVRQRWNIHLSVKYCVVEY